MVLSDLNTGQEGMITHFEDSASALFAESLRNLGIEKNVLVKILHLGFPAKDPIAVRVGNHTVALSKKNAQKILVSLA